MQVASRCTKAIYQPTALFLFFLHIGVEAAILAFVPDAGVNNNAKFWSSSAIHVVVTTWELAALSLVIRVPFPISVDRAIDYTLVIVLYTSVSAIALRIDIWVSSQPSQYRSLRP